MHLKKQSHGIKWEQFIPIILKEKITKKNEEEVAEIIESFLKEKYRVEENALLQYVAHLKLVLNKAGNNFFPIMARITENPIYRNDFTGFITTFPRGPYDTGRGYIWMIYDKTDERQIKAFIHELLHMQFEHYYKEKLLKLINEEQFSFLKESMTIIINKEFLHITSEQDRGYPIHQEFRKYLLNLWEHRQNFPQFISEAVKHVNEFQNINPAL